MPDEKELQSGRRLAEDLRRLREDNDVSINTLHDETKIPMGLIESFEEDALFGHPMFNRVYLRSFVRTYAQVVGLDADRVSQSLEAALRGEYSGELIEGPSKAEAEPAEAEDDSEPRSTEGEAAGAVAGAPEEGGSEEPQETTQTRREGPKRQIEREERQPEQRKKEEETASSGTEAGAVTSPPTAKPRDTEGRSDRRRSRSSGSGGATWIYVVGGAVVLALLVWLGISLLGGDEPDSAQQPVAADTAAASVQPDTARREPEFEPVAIGDSIDVEVVAADGPIRELRIRRDDETRRPHWIEAGQSETFRAVNRIAFSPPVEATQERPMDMMRLLVEGREYPTSQRNEEGQIIITRERAQTVLDSLARARQ